LMYFRNRGEETAISQCERPAHHCSKLLNRSG
jgi:hypothetical protein